MKEEQRMRLGGKETWKVYMDTEPPKFRMRQATLLNSKLFCLWKAHSAQLEAGDAEPVWPPCTEGHALVRSSLGISRKQWSYIACFHACKWNVLQVNKWRHSDHGCLTTFSGELILEDLTSQCSYFVHYTSCYVKLQQQKISSPIS